MTKPISIRASFFTTKQIDDLVKFTGMSKTGILALAINNLYVNTVLVGDAFNAIRTELIKQRFIDLGLTKNEVNEMLDVYFSSGYDENNDEEFNKKFRLLMFSNRQRIMELMGYRTKE